MGAALTVGELLVGACDGDSVGPPELLVGELLAVGTVGDPVGAALIVGELLAVGM